MDFAGADSEQDRRIVAAAVSVPVGILPDRAAAEAGRLNAPGRKTKLKPAKAARGQDLIGAALIGMLAFTLTMPHAAASPGGEADATETSLALKLRNPIADLITVPIESDFEFGSGSRDALTYTLNVQPVIPFELTKDWLLVTRTIVPFIYQEGVAAGEQTKTGIGDITQSFFLSPSSLMGGWIVGAGPVFQYPSATDSAMGAGKWGAGPTAALVRQAGGTTFGVLANHIWSFAGDSRRGRANMTLVDPFISYTWTNDFMVEFDGESTFDWEQKQWTVPLTAGVSQLVTFGEQPVSFGLAGRWYAEHAADGPEWGVVFTVTLLFPR